MRIQRNRGGRSSIAHPGATQSAIEQAMAFGSNERLVGSNGELNAGSNKELFSRIIELAGRHERGEFQLEAASSFDRSIKSKERREELLASYHDHTSARWAELGASVAAEISNRVTRMGFSRRMLTRADVATPGIARIRVPENNVEAVVSTGPTQVGYEVIRGKYIFPTEFYIQANPRVEQKDISQGSGDILEELFLDAQQAILIQEDRTYIAMVNAAAAIYNGITYFTGQLTPAVVAQLQENVNGWGLPISNLMLSMDLIKDINTGTAFNDWLEPVSRLEIILTGRLGTLLGMDIMTDGFRDPKLKVLEPGELIVSTLPENLGAYTDRGPVQAEPRVNDKDFPGKGWYMFEEVSFTVANAKGIAKAKRI